MKIRGKFRTVSKNFSFTPNLLRISSLIIDSYRCSGEQGRSPFRDCAKHTKVWRGSFNSLLPSSIHKTADGYEKDEESDDISPDVGDTRGGTDGVVARNEPFACERIIDDAILEDSCTRIHYRARHFKRVSYRKPEDVELVGKFL